MRRLAVGAFRGERGVGQLDREVGVRQVGANNEVDVRCVVNLRVRHGRLR